MTRYLISREDAVNANGDLIYRADAIEAIQNAYCKPCKERGDDHNEVRCRACDYDNAIIQIDALPSAEGGWIPCSERLPDKADEYLCIDKDGDYEVGLWHPRLKHFFFNSCSLIGKPIAWMRLPEPYKEQTERSE